MDNYRTTLLHPKCTENIYKKLKYTMEKPLLIKENYTEMFQYLKTNMSVNKHCISHNLTAH